MTAAEVTVEGFWLSRSWFWSEKLCCLAEDLATPLDPCLLQLMQSQGMDDLLLPASCRLGEQPLLALEPTIWKKRS